MSLKTPFIELIRPHQWIKNIFIFLPLFFNGSIDNYHDWWYGIVAFLSFSLMASSIYCFNDILDVQKDRLHPEKSKRPIASGAITKNWAYFIMFLCLISSLMLVNFFCVKVIWKAIGVLLVYFIMNIGYTLKLKYYPIIDVFIIALGFILRVVLGGVVTNIDLSHWIILMTFLLALFLAFAKRRDDVVLYDKTGICIRSGIQHYNTQFLDQTMTVLATIMIVSYIMYSVSDEVIKRLHCQYVYLTSVFVILGILRYLQISIVKNLSGNPTKVLMKDRYIHITVLLWIVSFVIIIYL